LFCDPKNNFSLNPTPAPAGFESGTSLIIIVLYGNISHTQNVVDDGVCVKPTSNWSLFRGGFHINSYELISAHIAGTSTTARGGTLYHTIELV